MVEREARLQSAPMFHIWAPVGLPRLFPLETGHFRAKPEAARLRQKEVGEPAWRSRPSWWLIATGDLIIPPDLQRFMSKRAGSKVVEIEGHHAIYVSNPTAVAELIQTAVTELMSGG
jgi:pimeloyl-ACP methyl ester carboxylesterase